MPAPVRITAPAPGARVGRAATVAGRGRGTILLDGGCRGCQAIALADGGRWRTTLRLAPGRRTITAATADAGRSDTVAVTVRAPAAPPPAYVPTAAPTRAPIDRVVMVGDSLAVGTKTLLPQLLPGSTVTTDGRVGRPLAEGMDVIAATDFSAPTVLLVSLFTNDGPQDTDRLAAAIRASEAAVGPEGCVAWATIVRPPYGGVSYAAANGVIEAAAGPRMVVVPWARAVASQPDLVGGDGVHGTAAGYAARAQLYAEAVRECGG